MTSVATNTTRATTTSAADLVGRHGMGLFGKKNPKWYPCIVKQDNEDGTVKVQWDDGGKFTKKFPVEKFKVDPDMDEEPTNMMVDVLFRTNEDGDY